MDDIDVKEEEQGIDVDETSIETITRNATVVPSLWIIVKEEKQELDLTPPRTHS